jgi:hypothetical protein
MNELITTTYEEDSVHHITNQIRTPTPSSFSLFSITLPFLLTYPAPLCSYPTHFSSVTLCSSYVTRPIFQHFFSKFVLPSPLYLVHHQYSSSLPSLFVMLPALNYISLCSLFPISATSFFMFFSFYSCDVTFFLHSPCIRLCFFPPAIPASCISHVPFPVTVSLFVTRFFS